MFSPTVNRLWHFVEIASFGEKLGKLLVYFLEQIWSLLNHENLTTGNKILWKRGEIESSVKSPDQ